MITLTSFSWSDHTDIFHASSCLTPDARHRERASLCLPLSNPFWIFFSLMSITAELCSNLLRQEHFIPPRSTFPPLYPCSQVCGFVASHVLCAANTHPALAGQCCSAHQHNVLDTVCSPNHTFENRALVRGFLSHHHWTFKWRPVQTAAWWVSLSFPP